MATNNKPVTNPNQNYIDWEFGRKEQAEPAKHYRGKLKTSILTGSASSPKTSTLTAFVQSLVSSTDDQYMRMKYKRMPLTRVSEERKNVSVRAWMYAARLEDDNDFHVIVGDTPKKTPDTTFFNVEISGLPSKSSNDYKTLQSVRKKFISFFPKDNLYTKYAVPKVPIKVHLKGSLFFDGDHQQGKIGPVGFRPKTVWEFHPISAIS